MQWLNRQKDWYNAERRFIFAAPNDKLKHQWIKQIEKEKQRQISAENSLKNRQLGKAFIQKAKGLKKINKTQATNTATNSTRPSAPPSHPPSGTNSNIICEDHWRSLNVASGSSRANKRNKASVLDDSQAELQLFTFSEQQNSVQSQPRRTRQQRK